MFLYFALGEPEEQRHLHLCVNPDLLAAGTPTCLSGYLVTTILSALCFLVIHEISAAAITSLNNVTSIPYICQYLFQQVIDC